MGLAVVVGGGDAEVGGVGLVVVEGVGLVVVEGAEVEVGVGGFEMAPDGTGVEAT